MQTESQIDKIAVTDIGSNTIRTVVYGIRGNTIRKLYSERDYTGLLDYVRDGRLSDEGIEHLCSVLGHMGRFCALCGCGTPNAFSTAALRSVVNRADVFSAVYGRTGIRIHPLSAEGEMQCDCAGLLRAGVTEGYAFDLGGGSCQLFSFGPDGLRGGVSLPFGCLSIGRHFVRQGLFPTHEEARAVRRFVRGMLEEHLPRFAGIGMDRIYAMGGTARAAAKVRRALYPETADTGETLLEGDRLRDFVKRARKDEGGTVALLRRVTPGRMSTLVPGILAMETILRYCGCGTLRVMPVGVREGFLWTHLLPTPAP